MLSRTGIQSLPPRRSLGARAPSLPAMRLRSQPGPEERPLQFVLERTNRLLERLSKERNALGLMNESVQLIRSSIVLSVRTGLAVPLSSTARLPKCATTYLENVVREGILQPLRQAKSRGETTVAASWDEKLEAMEKGIENLCLYAYRYLLLKDSLEARVSRCRQELQCNADSPRKADARQVREWEEDRNRSAAILAGLPQIEDPLTYKDSTGVADIQKANSDALDLIRRFGIRS